MTIPTPRRKGFHARQHGQSRGHGRGGDSGRRGHVSVGEGRQGLPRTPPAADSEAICRCRLGSRSAPGCEIISRVAASVSRWVRRRMCGETNGRATESVSLSSIATGFESSSMCGTSSTAELWCWGDNSVGQLGNGTTLPRFLPVRSGRSLSLASVSIGSSFSCGVTPTGAAYCWGMSSTRASA
jgi:hypothetical protein